MAVHVVGTLLAGRDRAQTGSADDPARAPGRLHGRQLHLPVRRRAHRFVAGHRHLRADHRCRRPLRVPGRGPDASPPPVRWPTGSRRPPHESPHRLRLRDPARLHGCQLHDHGRRARSTRLRLALALRAHHRRRPRSDHRARRRGRTYHPAQARDQCAGAVGTQPGLARRRSSRAWTSSAMDASCPRSAWASRTRPNSRRSGSSDATAPAGSKRRSHSSGASGPRTRSTTTASDSTTRDSGSGPGRCNTRPTSGSAGAHPWSCGASVGSPTVGWRRSRSRPSAPTAGGRSRRWPPSTTARSIPNISGR